MSLGLIAIVIAVGVGAVMAVAAREPGLAAIGLALALVASAVLADPLPPVVLLAVRVVAALLAVTLVRSAIVVAPRQPSRLGWAGEALIATAAMVAGVGAGASLAILGAAPAGPDGGSVVVDTAAVGASAAMLGAAAFLLALGLAPLIAGRPGPRLAVALLLVAEAGLLVRAGLAGNPGELEEIARAALLVACGGIGAALSRAVTAGAPMPAALTREADAS